MEKIIELRGITKEFDGERVLNAIDLYIRDNEFVTLLGPSGCGKTTTLRIIGGFVTPDEGEVYFDGKKINDLPPYKRQVNTVFQKYALFPHLNVYENVAFAMRVIGAKEKDIKERVPYVLELVGLENKASRHPGEMSGGEQQRRAIARALVNNPSTIIADEPTGNLDPARSFEIMALLQEINNLGTTVLVVTHEKDLVERFAKRVIAIDEGLVVSDGMEGYYSHEAE